ncbi:GMC family oxidoreductase [Allopusillimonas ginsengisoli]|uniref:GMC family oxidoreductase n=1 Tax=Allopusillimonas ginsengisoli TaxID=453575 RepID=UPI0010228B45|nr:GMC family oxidoreductase N-terminal domain-containing protein [Allopusillimonas ginsengisoli]TEA76927.1 dehydrogenase [Allopusillimonas ginsengisoli]
MNKQQSFDYIVVGGGSAGCVIASRLSEQRNVRVLLLEAGGGDGRKFWTKIPLGVGKLVNDPTCLWEASAGPEASLGQRSVRWMSGRIMGGGSSVNGMLAVRGNPSRYDDWENEACPGMGYEKLLPYFKKLETCDFSSSEKRGKNGPIGISRIEPEPVGAAFMSACKGVGLERLEDFNSDFREGATFMQASIRRGRRMSASKGYIDPVRSRSNLVVKENVVVRRILFDGLRATGVEVEEGGQHGQYLVSKEVILCAGAIRSPQILELSGIGSASVLEKFGISPILNLPGVGKNLQDHYMVRVCFRSTVPLTIYDFLNSNMYKARELAKYLASRSGMFACGSLTAMAFQKSDPGIPYPDIRIQLGLSSGAQRVSKNENSGLDPFSAFHIGGYYIHPHSRGELHIQSVDPRVSPKIAANYLQTEQDQKIIVDIVRRIRAIAQQSPLKEQIKEEIRPGPSVIDDAEILQYAKSTGDTCWHPLGTCRMGQGPLSVVDHEFRVRGIEGVRVADASVAPFQVSSNTNIPTIAVAERAADVIRGA